MTITFNDFLNVEQRIGTIVGVEDFPEARKPAYKLTIDFGEFGTKRSSAQLTKLYHKNELIGRQVIAVMNFPARQVANFMSECLVLGFETPEGVVLMQPERKVPNGTRVS